MGTDKRESQIPHGQRAPRESSGDRRAHHFTPDVDVAIVGAGVAGLAAAKTARARGLSVAVLEAARRIGGRALTDTETLGVPFDRGCYWMHRARDNPFRWLADRLGARYSRGDGPRRTFLGDRWATPAEERARAQFNQDASAVVERAGERGRDIAASTVLSPWLARPGPWGPLFCSEWTANMGAPPERCSTVDFYNFEEAGDWPVRDGLGALVARYGADVDVTLGAAVSRIDWSGAGVRVTTTRGPISARALIITVSTGVLAAGGLTFVPALPPWKLAAIDALPMGHANKVALKFTRDIFGEDFGMAESTLVDLAAGAPDTPGLLLRPFGRALAVAHFSGDLAVALERAGELAMVSYARDQLKTVLGASVADHLEAFTSTAWSDAPWTRGAYSAALPGHALAREAYARPVAERLFFAGEAASCDGYGSVHGALETGVSAAEQVLELVAAARGTGEEGPPGSPEGSVE
jgi:monoamine oxidase